MNHDTRAHAGACKRTAADRSDRAKALRAWLRRSWCILAISGGAANRRLRWWQAMSNLLPIHE